MKSEKEIEAWVRSTDPNTHPSVDETVLKHMLEARQQTQQGQNIYLRPLGRRLSMEILRVAAMLLLVLGIGFGAGRLSVPSAEAMKATLERSLKASLQADMRASVRQEMEQQWTSHTAEHTDGLQQEMVLLMRQALAESMTQTRTVCQAYTEQRLGDLVQLIERARTEDRRHIAVALERLETHRQQDKDLLKRGIVALTLQTQGRPVREVN